MRRFDDVHVLYGDDIQHLINAVRDVLVCTKAGDRLCISIPSLLIPYIACWDTCTEES